MIILSSAALVIFTFLAISNIYSFATQAKPDFVGIGINFIFGVICMSGIGIVYDEFKSDMKVLHNVSFIQR